jgi:prepilin-type N-terminal cleavage/methylation domain-containing protein
MRKSHILFQGFTLIELLIVVAIIAILAAIAVPNFLEAQIRSKVSRAKSDLRTYATALEAYRVDNNAYPVEGGLWGTGWNMNNPASFIVLSTPIAYLTNPWLADPFKHDLSVSSNPGMPWNKLPKVYAYSNLYLGNPRIQKFTRPGAFPLVEGRDLKTNNTELDPRGFAWMMVSYGPDGLLQADDDPAIPNPVDGVNINIYMPYDATNGTKSMGDIWRLGP